MKSRADVRRENIRISTRFNSAAIAVLSAIMLVASVVESGHGAGKRVAGACFALFLMGVSVAMYHRARRQPIETRSLEDDSRIPIEYRPRLLVPFIGWALLWSFACVMVLAALSVQAGKEMVRAAFWAAALFLAATAFLLGAFLLLGALLRRPALRVTSEELVLKQLFMETRVPWSSVESVALKSRAHCKLLVVRYDEHKTVVIPPVFRMSPEQLCALLTRELQRFKGSQHAEAP